MELTFATESNFEFCGSYEVTVRASNGIEWRDCKLKFTVLDNNDCPILQPQIRRSVVEDAARGDLVGDPIHGNEGFEEDFG